MSDDVLKFKIDDSKDLADLRKISMSIGKALVFLSPTFACGVDIKFEVAASSVLVLQEELGQYHQIRQMFGRGMRDHVTGTGVLYTKKPAGSHATLATELMIQESSPFLEGVDVIKEMKRQVKANTSKRGKKLANGTSVDWILNLSDYKKKR